MQETTNNQMEFKAAIEGLKAFSEPCNVILTTDSKYVMQGYNFMDKIIGKKIIGKMLQKKMLKIKIYGLS